MLLKVPEGVTKGSVCHVGRVLLSLSWEFFAAGELQVEMRAILYPVSPKGL